MGAFREKKLEWLNCNNLKVFFGGGGGVKCHVLKIGG
jgi:hypothetical protein